MNFRLLVIGFVIYKDYFIVLKRLKGIVEFNDAVTVIIFYLLCDPLLGKSLPVMEIELEHDKGKAENTQR